MSNTPQDSMDNESDFVLKHRIVGAAFLLFFGALVLPWMLGPPSEASKDPSATPIPVVSNDEALPEDVENEILQALQEADAVQDDEQVYISKITPLDRLKSGQQEDAQNVAENKNTPQVLDEINSKSTKTVTQKESSTVAPKESSNKNNNAKESADNKEKKAVVVGDAKKPKPSDTVATKSTDKKDSDTDKSNKAAADLAAALAAESATMKENVNKNKIDVGWIVQVGVFTDKNGASKVVEDLTKKGFTPATSIVDTNKGKNTGTRVWLGPFVQRAEADKTKTRLTERTGESGFIRAYP